ncbi:MAG: hypothetical protein IT373_28540, partial [Polyangiaceae bacterium]|nr:hypothetical protein [Polyangiaceae bacterium]
MGPRTRLAAFLASTLLAFACGPRPVATSTLASGAGDAPERRPPCDPVSSREPAPPPPGTGATCGNGVLETLPGPCFEICAGGCGRPIACHVECSAEREHCDGAEASLSCESQGYAGGPMRCTPACQLDLTACVACVPGPGVRCGEAQLFGDEAYVVAAASGAAVFVRAADTGRLTGARVAATLRTERFAGLPQRTLAAGALDGGLGYVDAERRFGVLDGATGRA